MTKFMRRRKAAACSATAVDEPERCDFYFPAVVRRGELQIAISTGGLSPALAQRLRKELEQQFGPEWEEVGRAARPHARRVAEHSDAAGTAQATAAPVREPGPEAAVVCALQIVIGVAGFLKALWVGPSGPTLGRQNKGLLSPGASGAKAPADEGFMSELNLRPTTRLLAHGVREIWRNRNRNAGKSLSRGGRAGRSGIADAQGVARAAVRGRRAAR